jgi:hypothetical protein
MAPHLSVGAASILGLMMGLLLILKMRHFSSLIHFFNSHISILYINLSRQNGSSYDNVQ